MTDSSLRSWWMVPGSSLCNGCSLACVCGSVLDFTLPADSSCLGLGGLPAASPQLRETPTLCLGPLPAPQPGSSPGKKPGGHRGRHVSSRRYWPSLLMSKVFKIVLHISSGFLGGVCKVGKGSREAENLYGSARCCSTWRVREKSRLEDPGLFS